MFFECYKSLFESHPSNIKNPLVWSQIICKSRNKPLVSGVLFKKRMAGLATNMNIVAVLCVWGKDVLSSSSCIRVIGD